MYVFEQIDLYRYSLLKWLPSSPYSSVFSYWVLKQSINISTWGWCWECFSAFMTFSHVTTWQPFFVLVWLFVLNSEKYSEAQLSSKFLLSSVFSPPIRSHLFPISAHTHNPPQNWKQLTSQNPLQVIWSWLTPSRDRVGFYHYKNWTGSVIARNSLTSQRLGTAE